MASPAPDRNPHPKGSTLWAMWNLRYALRNLGTTAQAEMKRMKLWTRKP